MLKQHLAEIIAKRHSISKKLSNEIIASIFDVIKGEISVGKEYHHWGFGKFILSKRAERMIHNVTTGELNKLEERKNIKFIPSREFNRSLNS